MQIPDWDAAVCNQKVWRRINGDMQEMETGCERRRLMVTAGVSMRPWLTCTCRVKVEHPGTFHSFQQVNQSHAEMLAPMRDSLVWILIEVKRAERWPKTD